MAYAHYLQRGTPHEGDVVHLCALLDEDRDLVNEMLTIAQRPPAETVVRLLTNTNPELGIEG